jgi:membrane protease subunit HflK
MMTGDLNVLDVSWIVQFVVKDPAQLLFSIKNPRETVRDVSEAVMRQVVGDSSVDEALTLKRADINIEVQKRVQEILDRYESGIHIENVKLQDVVTPDAVKASFNEVNEAEQEKEKVINQSWEAYNKAVPMARGVAERTIREAEGYALSRINQAKGDAAKFVSLYEAYKSAKEVTRRRMYLETLGQVLPKAGKKYILEPEGHQVLPLLKLNESEK